MGQKFTAYEMDKESDGAEMQNTLEKMTGQRSVPNIFINGKHIGGCDTVVGLHKSGKLQELLK